MAETAAKKQKKDLYWLHVAIGFALLIIFSYVLPAPDPITPVGMKVVGAFVMMIYTWSTVGTLWPSLVGLFFVAISGVNANGFNAVWMSAVGNYTVLLTLFGMCLFGAVDYYGGTLYITKWILTRKVLAGRPMVFMILFYLVCYLLAGLISPITGLIIVWPIALRIIETMGVTREDAAWKYFFVGMFLVMTLGQPLLPFKGAALVPVAAYQSMTSTTMPIIAHMTLDVVMTFLIMVVYFILLKVLRVDFSKMKSVKPEMIEEQLPLPPMNFQQKAYLIMIPVYILLLIVPSLLPKTIPGVSFISSTLGVLGVTVAIFSFFLIVKWNGKPMMDMKEVAYKQFDWGIFFMIAAAVYAANQLSNEATGVSSWLVQVLNPILGGQSELAFIAIMFTVALIITNFANNAAMAVVLLPVVVSFSNQMGINPMPVATGVIMMVFVAMLTPAASPHAGMMWGRKDIYSASDIMSIGLPMCIVTLIMYVFIGYPLAKMLISVFGG